MAVSTAVHGPAWRRLARTSVNGQDRRCRSEVAADLNPIPGGPSTPSRVSLNAADSLCANLDYRFAGRILWRADPASVIHELPNSDQGDLLFMTKKVHKRPTRAKEAAKRITARSHVRRSAKGPSIPDLTDALAAVMANLKAAQISRLLGAAVPGGLPDQAEVCQAAAGKKKVGKARKEAQRKARKARKQVEKKARRAKKRAMKEAKQASPAGEADPKINDSGT